MNMYREIKSVHLDLEDLSSVSREFIVQRFSEIEGHHKIAVIGKSGMGKSSLLNAIFKSPVFETGAVGGCTRNIQKGCARFVVENELEKIGRTRFSFSRRVEKRFNFYDFPGIAENSIRDKEYIKLYQEQLIAQQYDLILWVIKVDDRATRADQELYSWLSRYYDDKRKIIFVLNQCDKAEPAREWDYETYRPSTNQLSIIQQNRKRISRDFGISSHRVIPISCEYYQQKYDIYNIGLLFARIVYSLHDSPTIFPNWFFLMFRYADKSFLYYLE